MCRIYHDLAPRWYRLFTPLEEYEDEAALYYSMLSNHGNGLHSMLELGSGAGHNAFFLKKWYSLTLVDLSESMSALSKEINPECNHVVGDMRTIQLNQTFDIVFIHDAIMYMSSEEDLRLAINNAFLHCQQGGWVLISPDYLLETFAPSTDHGGEDRNGRGLRYLEWASDPVPGDGKISVDYAFVLHEEDGSVLTAYDRHEEGVFSQQTWISFLQNHSNDPKAIPDHYGRINFLAQKR